MINPKEVEASKTTTPRPEIIRYVEPQAKTTTEAFLLEGIRYNFQYQDTSNQGLGKANWYLEYYNPTESFKAYCQPSNQVSVSSNFTFKPRLANRIFFHTEQLLVYFHFEDAQVLGDIWIKFDEDLTHDRLMTKVCLAAPNTRPIYSDMLNFGT